jgi:hypothetical protein
MPGLSPAPPQAFGIVAASRSIRAVIDWIRRVAPTGMNVLLSGETGTGRELVARAIDDESPRRKGRFVPANCAAIPESLVEVSCSAFAREHSLERWKRSKGCRKRHMEPRCSSTRWANFPCRFSRVSYADWTTGQSRCSDTCCGARLVVGRFAASAGMRCEDQRCEQARTRPDPAAILSRVGVTCIARCGSRPIVETSSIRDVALIRREEKCLTTAIVRFVVLSVATMKYSPAGKLWYLIAVTLGAASPARGSSLLLTKSGDSATTSRNGSLNVAAHKP